MGQIVRLTPEQLKEAALLADQVFRSADQKSMGDAFPYIFAAAIPESIGIYDDGKLAAFMGIVPGTIRIGEAVLNVYSLGSVCTHPDARGKGYASELLDFAIRHTDQAGAALLLVSGDRSLYLRAGCRPFGNIRKYTFEKEQLTAEKPVNFKIRSSQPGDSFAIAELAAHEATGYGLSLYDVQLLLQAESFASCLTQQHETLVAEYPEGGMAAFAVIGVPSAPHITSTPRVIEAAGNPEAITGLIGTAAHKRGLDKLEYAVSPFRTGLMHELDQLDGAAAEVRNSGTIKIMDPVRLWNQLLPYLAARHEDAKRLTVSVEPSSDRKVNIHLDSRPAFSLDLDSFLGLIFNQGGVKEAALPEQLDHILSQLLPVPFPYTEGLYYI